MYLSDKTKRIIRIIGITVFVLTALSVFMFSSQPVEQSDALSNQVMDIIPDGMSGIKKVRKVWGISFSLRKYAHMILYTVLGINSMSVFLTLDKPKLPLRMVIPMALCFAYSVSDEFHQKFVPGRSCEWKDVLIDSIGYVTGGIIIILVFSLINLILKRRHKNNISK